MSQQFPRFLDDPPPPPRPVLPVMEAPVLLQPEQDAASAIGADWNPPRLAGGRRRPGSLALAVAGVGIIIGAWLLFSIITSVIGFFQVSAGLGLAAAFVAGVGLALLAAGALREWWSLRLLRHVEQLRTALVAGTDLAMAQRLCLSWLDSLHGQVPEAAAIAKAVRDATDVAEIRGMLRGRVAPALASATRTIGLRAASEVSALVAISPHASWDGPIVALRGLKVIRQVAQLHGLRPGPAVTLALFGRVARAAVETATVDLVSQTAADHFLNNLPLVRHLGAISGASTAAFRLYRLTGAAARACSPLDD